MFHNLTGETKRWLVVLMSGEDIIDRNRMARFFGWLPSDVRVVGVDHHIGNQLAVMLDSIEFMEISHGGTVPMKCIDQMKPRK